MKLSISLSETWRRLSTSRSRRRFSRMSCRTSSRNWANEMPSASSRWRSAGTVMLFDSAMRIMAALTVASSTRTPVSRASWSCARSTIMRSSTWRASTSCGGGAIFCRCSCTSASRVRERSSLAVITSSLTTAMMRSTGCVVRADGAGRAAGGALASRSGRGGRFRLARRRRLLGRDSGGGECNNRKEARTGARAESKPWDLLVVLEHARLPRQRGDALVAGDITLQL